MKAEFTAGQSKMVIIDEMRGSVFLCFSSSSLMQNNDEPSKCEKKSL